MHANIENVEIENKKIQNKSENEVPSQAFWQKGEIKCATQTHAVAQTKESTSEPVFWEIDEQKFIPTAPQSIMCPCVCVWYSDLIVELLTRKRFLSDNVINLYLYYP